MNNTRAIISIKRQVNKFLFVYTMHAGNKLYIQIGFSETCNTIDAELGHNDRDKVPNLSLHTRLGVPQQSKLLYIIQCRDDNNLSHFLN